MRFKTAAAMSALATLIATGASAHHSSAMFDRSKIVTLDGVIKEFQFVAPHSWLIIEAKGPKGKSVEWDLEGASAPELRRVGATPDVLKPGAKIKVRMHPLHDGRKGGALIDMTLADGKVITNNVTRAPQGVL